MKVWIAPLDHPFPRTRISQIPIWIVLFVSNPFHVRLTIYWARRDSRGQAANELRPKQTRYFRGPNKMIPRVDRMRKSAPHSKGMFPTSAPHTSFKSVLHPSPKFARQHKDDAPLKLTRVGRLFLVRSLPACWISRASEVGMRGLICARQLPVVAHF